MKTGKQYRRREEDLTGYINAGGRGTRLNSVFVPHTVTGVSKALLEIGKPSIPLVNHQINKLTTAGMPNIVVGAGDHNSVADHVRTVYANRPDVYAIVSSRQLGNGGDLVIAAKAYHQLFAGQVLVTNVDTVLDIDEADLIQQHQEVGAGLTIALTQNKGVPNEGAYWVSHNSKVVYCAETTEEPASDGVQAYTAYKASSTGTLVVDSNLLRSMDWSSEEGPMSLYRDIVGFAFRQGVAYGYNNGNRLFIDVGTVEAWKLIQERPEVIQSVLVYGSNNKEDLL